MLLSGANVIIWDDNTPLFYFSQCYHLVLSCDVIIWDAMLSSGANVMIWDQMLSSGANVIIWHEMLSSGAHVIIWD
jgi:uncharacterized protein YheU (UPF0270 family)